VSIKKERLSGSLLFFLTLGFVQGSSLTLTLASGIAQQNTWLALLGGFILGAPFIWTYFALMKRFPGRNLIQINDLVFGGYLGKFISLLYIWFFFTLIALDLRFYGDFFLIFIMPETPPIVFLAAMTIVCAYTARRGLETIARLTVFIVMMGFFFFGVDTILLAGHLQFTNLLPLFSVSGKELLKSSHNLTATVFCETLVFMMIIPYGRSFTGSKRGFSHALALGTLFLIGTVIRDVLAIGNLYPLCVAPTLEAIRLINLAKVLTRMELLVAIAHLATEYIKICVFYYAAALGLAQLFKLRSYQPLILPLGGLAVGLAVLAFGSSIEQGYAGTHYYPIYTILFELILPVITLLLAKVRDLPNKAAKNG